MSEYWVSKKKYYCQYCEIYIADDAPSRSQHENGLRHKGNKDRFIRGLYKAGVKKKQESEEEKREMKRVEEAAQAAYARDVGAGLAKAGASSSSTVPVVIPKPKPPPPKPSDPYANYTTAASLGFTDLNADRLVAEAEVTKNEGRVGDWIAVVPPPPPLPQNGGRATPSEAKAEPGTGEVRKRNEVPPDDDDGDDARRFKIRKKTVSVGLGEIYDPGIIAIKPRVDPIGKTEVEVGSNPVPGPTLGSEVLQKGVGLQETIQGPKATEKPAWTRREWKWAGEDKEDLSEPRHVDGPFSDLPQEIVEEIPFAVKTENDGAVSQPRNGDGDVKEEEPLADTQVLSGESAAGSSLFRKRKTPRTASTRGRREV